ncbi:hypothetical protein F4808DRAFT_414744 [Astrocystis sublimbata]|nr:hypothetical protein F4808DRAFT_414744 [Astrocystis sublimbata]
MVDDTPSETIAFIGASGGVGLAALKHSLDSGRRCVALCRKPEKLTTIMPLEKYPNLRVMQGNAHDVAALSKCLLARPGVLVDQIVSTIGGAFIASKLTIDDPEVCAKGTAALLEALDGLRRNGALGRPHIIVCSTAGTSKFGRDIPIAVVPFHHIFLKVPAKDKVIMEDRIVASGENFTIVRPSIMSSEEETTKTVRVGIEDPKTGVKSSAIGYSITKGDAGRWIAEVLILTKSNEYNHMVATITS